MKNDSRNNVYLKKNNLREILRILKIFPDITKNEIAGKIAMTSVSAHNLINELVEVGICKSSGMVPSCGRKAVKYRLNKDYGCIIGINVFRTRVHFTAFDLDDNMLAEKYESCVINDKEATIDLILSGISELMRMLRPLDIECLCIGIGIVGRANKDGRIVLMPDAHIWCGCPLKEIIEKHFHVSVYVDNDNNANMLSSKWMNVINGKTNAAFVSITEGVGMGIIISNDIYRGAKDNGSEIGHTIINIDGKMCRCGNNGCLQAYISDQAIFHNLANLLDTKYPGLKTESLATVAEYAKKNNCHDLYAVFYHAAGYISIALQNIIKIYDPSIIIINNNWLKYVEDIFYDIKMKVFKYCNINDAESTEIIIDIDKKIIDIAPALMAFDHYVSDFNIKECTIL